MLPARFRAASDGLQECRRGAQPLAIGQHLEGGEGKVRTRVGTQPFNRHGKENSMDSRRASLPRRATTVLWGLAFLLVASADPAWAGSANPKVNGKTIGDWGHAWWQWASNFSSETNPIGQNGDVDCSAGQSGKVWFLAGTFGASATRTCSIPRGRALFFPLFNVIFWTPEDCTFESACRGGAAALIDNLRSWSCTVDGTPCVFSVPVVRAQSDARPLDIPEGSFWEDFGTTPGLRPLSVADGYWVMLDPLPPGPHQVTFTASAPDLEFALSVTYILTVGR